MSYDIDGMSLRTYCKKNGLHYFSVIQRMIDKCETAEQAAKKIKSKVLYGGKSRVQICKEYDISYSACCRLMRQRKMSLSDSIKTLLTKKQTKGEKNVLSD